MQGLRQDQLPAARRLQELRRARVQQGKLLTHTVIRVGPSQFADQTPYAVGVAELDDGVRMTAMIADVDFDELKVGMPVKLEFRKVRDEGEAGIICYGYKFVPVR